MIRTVVLSKKHRIETNDFILVVNSKIIRFRFPYHVTNIGRIAIANNIGIGYGFCITKIKKY